MASWLSCNTWQLQQDPELHSMLLLLLSLETLYRCTVLCLSSSTRIASIGKSFGFCSRSILIGGSGQRQRSSFAPSEYNQTTTSRFTATSHDHS